MAQIIERLQRVLRDLEFFLEGESTQKELLDLFDDMQVNSRLAYREILQKGPIEIEEKMSTIDHLTTLCYANYREKRPEATEKIARFLHNDIKQLIKEIQQK